MVARTVIDITCDWCAGEGKANVKGETRIIGGVKFDACSRHYRSELAPVEAIVKRYGRPVDEIAFTIPGPRAAGRAKPAVKAMTEAGTTTRVGRAADLRCGDCGSLLMKASKYWHASKIHGKSACDIEWAKP